MTSKGNLSVKINLKGENWRKANNKWGRKSPFMLCPGKDHFMKLFELLEMNGDNIFNSIDLLLLMAYALFMYIFYKNVVTKVIKGKSNK